MCLCLFVFAHSLYYASHKDSPVPEHHEGEADEEPESAPEVRHQGGQRVDQASCLHRHLSRDVPDTHKELQKLLKSFF